MKTTRDKLAKAKSGIALFGISCCLFVACNERRPATGDELPPGPATEVDKQRYNLNPSDEMLYDPLDSLSVDSLETDTL